MSSGVPHLEYAGNQQFADLAQFPQTFVDAFRRPRKTMDAPTGWAYYYLSFTGSESGRDEPGVLQYWVRVLPGEKLPAHWPYIVVVAYDYGRAVWYALDGDLQREVSLPAGSRMAYPLSLHDPARIDLNSGDDGDIIECVQWRPYRLRMAGGIDLVFFSPASRTDENR